MIGTIFKFLWVIWVTVVCFHYCSMTHIPLTAVAHGHEFIAGGEDIPPPPEKPQPKISPKSPDKSKSIERIQEYTVVAGDTLGQIAHRYGTTWEKLWDLNRDRIADPNLIYIGQKIRLVGKVIPSPPPMTRGEKINKLAKFMFKTSNLRYESKNGLESCIQMHQESLSEGGFQWMDNQRQLLARYHEMTKQYEIWLLAEAIVDTAKDDETFYRLVGLAWQESHFLNKTGKDGEVSCFQFLPSTIKGRFGLDDVQLVKALWDLRNDPKIATVLALDMMADLQWNWLRWNGGTEFGYHVNNKIHWFRQAWLKK